MKKHYVCGWTFLLTAFFTVASVIATYSGTGSHYATLPTPPADNCAFSEGQFLFNFHGEQIYAHYHNGSLFAAYQDGSGFKPQSWVQQAGGAVGFDQNKVGCFAQNDPRMSTSTPTTPANPSSGNCVFSEGQFLFNFNGEQIYAHYHNGVLFASYQNASQGFKPQS